MIDFSSNKEKIVFLLLSFSGIFFSLGIIGIMLMWKWTSWPKKIKAIITVPYFFIIIISLTTIIYLSIGQPYRVSGESMLPNYKPESLVFTKRLYSNDTLKRGDVVVFTPPSRPYFRIIHRIVGLPGETVMIQNGNIYINGQELNEDYLPSSIVSTTIPGGDIQEGVSYIIPQGQFFILGDNREVSRDSRGFGFVPRSDIIGKVTGCYWNCE